MAAGVPLPCCSPSPWPAGARRRRAVDRHPPGRPPPADTARARAENDAAVGLMDRDKLADAAAALRPGGGGRPAVRPGPEQPGDRRAAAGRAGGGRHRVRAGGGPDAPGRRPPRATWGWCSSRPAGSTTPSGATTRRRRWPRPSRSTPGTPPGPGVRRGDQTDELHQMLVRLAAPTPGPTGTPGPATRWPTGRGRQRCRPGSNPFPLRAGADTSPRVSNGPGGAGMPADGAADLARMGRQSLAPSRHAAANAKAQATADRLLQPRHPQLQRVRVTPKTRIAAPNPRLGSAAPYSNREVTTDPILIGRLLNQTAPNPPAHFVAGRVDAWVGTKRTAAESMQYRWPVGGGAVVEDVAQVAAAAAALDLGPLAVGVGHEVDPALRRRRR